MKVIELSTTLDAPIEKVWKTLLKVETFLYVTRGVLGAPALKGHIGPFSQGQSVEVRMYFLHVLPALWKHHLLLETIDEENHFLQSREHSGPLKTWDHKITLTELPDGKTKYTDQVEIDAGPMTGAVKAFAEIFFRYRQYRWRRLVGGRILLYII